jgi:hypothetical protein
MEWAMDNELLNRNLGRAARPFDNKAKEQPKDLLSTLIASSTFTTVVGMLLTGTGVICFVPFHNRFSKLLLIVGLVTALFGFLMKIIDVCLKFVGGKRR